MGDAGWMIPEGMALRPKVLLILVRERFSALAQFVNEVVITT